jgi:hypothetical protein
MLGGNGNGNMNGIGGIKGIKEGSAAEGAPPPPPVRRAPRFVTEGCGVRIEALVLVVVVAVSFSAIVDVAG